MIGAILAGVTGEPYIAPTGDFESIATISVGAGGATNIEFTSIPGTYQHLQLRFIARLAGNNDSGGQPYQVQLNGDTATNYASHFVYGNGSSALAGAITNAADTAFWRITTPTQSSSVFGVAVYDFLDYSNTNKFTTIRGLGGFDNNGSGLLGLTSGLWRNTNAVTSIKMFTTGTTTAQYSHFALYGIKG
jgi:hypothetical protein